MRHDRRALFLIGLGSAGCPQPLDDPGLACPDRPGWICALAGTGTNGFGGEGGSPATAHLSMPTGVGAAPGKPLLIADWNNHRVRLIDGDRVETVIGEEFPGDGDPALAEDSPSGAPGLEVALNHPTQVSWLPDHCPEGLAGRALVSSWHNEKLRTFDLETGLVHVLLGAYEGGWNGVEQGEDAATALLDHPFEALPDAECDLLFTDMRNGRIRRLDLVEGTVDTVAGTGDVGYGGDGGPALEATFAFPSGWGEEPGGGLALDVAGRVLYVADTDNHVIRVVDLPSGRVDLVAGRPGVSGFADGPAASATFWSPVGLALDPEDGELFVADRDNHRVRVIDLDAGAVRTLAGTGEPTCGGAGDLPSICDDQAYAGDGGDARDATLFRPMGVDLLPDGDLVIADTFDHRLRRVRR